MPEHMPPTPALLARGGHQPFFDPLSDWEASEGPPLPLSPLPPDDLPAKVDLETQPNAWQPVSLPGHPSLNYFPSMVLAGVEKGQLLCHANDPAGRHLPVWLAKLAAGSISLDAAGNPDKAGPLIQETVLSLCADSLPEIRLEESIDRLTHEGIRLLTAMWPAGPDGKRVPTFQTSPLLDQAIFRARAELMPLLGEALQAAAPSGRVAWLDGRLRYLHIHGLGQEAESSDDFHLLAIDQTHPRELLHPAGSRCRMELLAGNRTPAFLLPGNKNFRDLVSWFVRLWPAPTHAPEAGLVRVEVTRGWWDKHGPSGANAASAWMIRLRHTDQPEPGPGSLEPILKLRQTLQTALDDLPNIANRLKILWHLT